MAHLINANNVGVVTTAPVVETLTFVFEHEPNH